MKQKINDSLLNDTSNLEIIDTISSQDSILSIYDFKKSERLSLSL